MHTKTYCTGFSTLDGGVGIAAAPGEYTQCTSPYKQTQQQFISHCSDHGYGIITAIDSVSPDSGSPGVLCYKLGCTGKFGKQGAVCSASGKSGQTVCF